MPFKVADYEECSEKCKCQSGPNEGVVYSKAEPCEEGSYFEEEDCVCVDDIPCGQQFSLRGNVGVFSDSYKVGNPKCPEQTTANILAFRYEAYSVKDAFDVTGGASFSTGGLISGGRTVYLPLSGENVTVSVIGGQLGTAWNYGLLRECGPCDEDQ